jgi:hypothetical protein
VTSKDIKAAAWDQMYAHHRTPKQAAAKHSSTKDIEVSAAETLSLMDNLLTKQVLDNGKGLEL